eukprot:g24165.t1
MSEVTYHRQIDGGPVIVVKNGFLDERCGPEESHAVGVQRSKSAPTPFTAEMQTEDAESRDASTSFAGSEQRSPPGRPAEPADATTPASPVLQPLNAQLLQLLTAQAQAAQVMNAVSAQQFWQLQMQPSMQSRPSSVQPSMHSSPQISPQLAPQLGHHVPQLLLSPLMPPGPEPSLPPSPDSSRPQSPQPVNPCPVGRQAPQPHTIRHSLNMETGMHQAPGHLQWPRGPVKHNFAELSTCGLRKGDEMWDFTKAVDKETQTFAVCLEIASLGT